MTLPTMTMLTMTPTTTTSAATEVTTLETVSTLPNEQTNYFTEFPHTFAAEAKLSEAESENKTKLHLS